LKKISQCLEWVQSLTRRARLLLFTPSTYLDFSLPWFLLLLGLTLNRAFCDGSWVGDQRGAICLSSWHLGHSGCQTFYRVRGCTSSCRHHFRFSGRISFGEPSSMRLSANLNFKIVILFLIFIFVQAHLNILKMKKIGFLWSKSLKVRAFHFISKFPEL
jgi:hypothetical protein